MTRLFASTQIGLRAKAVFAALTIVLVAMGTVTWLGAVRSEATLRAAMSSTAEGLAESIAAACELPLAVGDDQELERLAHRFIEVEPAIAFIAVYDNDNVRITRVGESYRDPEIGHERDDLVHDDCMLRRATVQDIGVLGDLGGMSDLVHDEDAGNTRRAPVTTGYVEVGYSLAEMQSGLSQLRRRAALTILAAMAICALIVIPVVGRWTRRLESLVSASEHISEGDLSYSIEDDRPDEIGTLVRTFERMRVAISERDQLERNRREELMRARQEAVDANTAKSRFLAHMSHEIRTPLNGVVGMLDLLEKTSLETRQRRFVNIGRSSADALLTIINDILDFSKIEAGQLTLESIEFDVHDVIESVVEMLAPRGQEKGLEVAVSVARDIPRVAIGDPSRFRQIILNLVNNAIKFTSEGEVVVRASVIEEDEASQLVRVSVSDTGIGIPEEARNRLFKSFSQVDTSTTRKYGGTGLGLAICKSLVEMMGGEIGVTPGRTTGSEFWFSVRFDRTEKQPRQVQRLTLEGHRVLVVDDNQTNREILVEALRNWRAIPTAVADASKAIDVLQAASQQQTPFSIGIFDMQMPQMDGLQLADQIQADPAIDVPPLVMLSSMSESVNRDDLENFGFAAYLPKPVRLSTLYDTLVSVNGANAELISTDTAHARATNADSTFKGVRLLVAEDNSINQIVVTELLQELGIDVDIASNGQEAFDRWRGGQYHAILMDCEMPVMDGFRATRCIRTFEAENLRIAPVPIIALTANAIQGDRDRCLNAGMDDYLTKPIDPDALKQALYRHVGELPNTNEAADTIESPSEQHTVSASAHELPPAPISVHDGEPARAIDIDEALARCGGKAAILARVYEHYVQDAAADIDRMASLVQSAAHDDIARLAHSLKGASANISAQSAAVIAADMEQRARAAELDGFDDLLDSLRTEFERVRDAINAATPQLLSNEAKST